MKGAIFVKHCREGPLAKKTNALIEMNGCFLMKETIL